MNPYELDQEIDMLLFALSEAEDDIEINQLEEQLAALEMERDQMLENLWRAIRNASAIADMLKAEEKRLADKRKREERKVESLKRYVARFGGIEKGQKWQKDGQSFSWRRSQRVAFSDDFLVDSLPPLFKRVSVEPDKARLKEVLKNGGEVDGVCLEECWNLTVG